MRVWHGLDEVGADFGPSVVTIGNFDGVHRGHQEVLAHAKARAAELGGLPVVALTFDPHPMRVLRPDHAPLMLSEPGQRAELLTAAGAGPDVTTASDGIDLGPALAGGAADRGRVLHWDCGFQWAVRAGDLKLRWCDGRSAKADGIRRVEHAEPGHGVALYDLRADPGEQDDLAATRPDEVARLTELHRAWQAEVAAG